MQNSNVIRHEVDEVILEAAKARFLNKRVKVRPLRKPRVVQDIRIGWRENCETCDHMGFEFLMETGEQVFVEFYETVREVEG